MTKWRSHCRPTPCVPTRIQFTFPRRKAPGLDRLLARVDAMIEEDPVSRVRLRVPQKEGKMLSMLEAKARIHSRKYKDGAVEMEVEAPESVVRRVREWVVK